MAKLFLDSETRNELDLSEVGSHKYASHKSLEIILLAYAFGDEEVKIWEPLTEPIPKDLDGGLDDPFQTIVAWNGPGFDRLVFRKLGKEIDIDRWEDMMVRSRFMSLPGSQEKVASILEINTQKLIEYASSGQSIIEFFCSPLRLGGYETLFGIEETQWRDKTTHPKEWDRLRERVKTDVEGMREIYKRLSKFPMPDQEWEFFAANERTNDRGVYTDPVLLHGAAFVGEKEQEGLKKEFLELTQIAKPKSTKAVLRFVREHGYTFGSLNKQFVNRALNGECQLDAIGRRALELRIKLGKSALAKLDTIKECVEEDGRVRGLFNFMGAARTHRDSSALVQLQNLIKPSKEVEKNYTRALNLLRKADYDTIKKEFSSPTDVAAAAIRPIFRAPQGKKLLIADLSAIEVRGAAWLAGCERMSQMFRDHEIGCGFPDDEEHKCCNGRDPYLTFASLMDPTKTYEDIYKEFKAGNKAIRTNAKPPQLGCFRGDTLVLTNNGNKRIIDISQKDLVWDGFDWVRHEGCVWQGVRRTVNLAGVFLTPDHEIFLEENRTEKAWLVNQNIQLEKQAIDLATGSLSDLKQERDRTEQLTRSTCVDVNGADKSEDCTDSILSVETLKFARDAHPQRLLRILRTFTTIFRELAERLFTESEQGSARFGTDVQAKEMTITRGDTPIGESSAYSTAPRSSSNTASLFLILIRRITRLIESIITAITRKVTYGSLLPKSIIETKKEPNRLPTSVKRCPWLSFGRNTAPNTKGRRKYEVKSIEDGVPNRSFANTTNFCDVFDLKNCGPRHRFTILTSKGPMLVHNCGYGLGPGETTVDAEGNDVKTGLLNYASSMQIELTSEYAEQAVQVYRNAYQEIPQFWWALHEAFISVVEHENPVEVGPLVLEKIGRVVCMRLPSGDTLHYINPEVIWTDAISKKGKAYKRSEIWIDGISQTTHQWSRIQTRGAKLFENAVQSICRAILYEGHLEAEKRGIPIVLKVHDELVAEVPENGNSVEELVECMTKPVSWAPGFLIAAEGQESDVYTKG